MRCIEHIFPSAFDCTPAHAHAMHLQSIFGEKCCGANVISGSGAISRGLVSRDVFEIEAGQSRKSCHLFLHGFHIVAEGPRNLLSLSENVTSRGAQSGWECRQHASHRVGTTQNTWASKATRPVEPQGKVLPASVEYRRRNKVAITIKIFLVLVSRGP